MRHETPEPARGAAGMGCAPLHTSPEAGEDTITAVLAAHAAAAPGRVAFVLRGRGGMEQAITRGELWRMATAFAARLATEGVKPGEPYLIALPVQAHAFAAFLGAMIAGAVPAFMPYPTAKQNAELFWDSHRKLFALIRVRHALTYRANAGMHDVLPPGAVRHIEDIADWFTGEAPRPAPARPGDTALLQHSSGTTGLKKGVMLSHAAVLAQVRHYAAAIGFGEDDVIASWLPLYHDMGLIACFIMPLLRGAKVVILDPFEWVGRPGILLDCIAQHRATFSWMPNFAFLHLVRTAMPGMEWDLSSLKGLINCSEPCKPETFAAFRERFGTVAPAALQVCYAMAENVFAVTQTPHGSPPRLLALDADAILDGRVQPAPLENGAGDRQRQLLSCGQPIGGATIAILGSAGQAVTDLVGEIAIQTDCLFTGYNALPALTAEKLVEGWYRTGDLGFMHEGELFVTGRRDDLMIIYGRNYYAHMIEEVASACAGVVPGRVVAFAVENAASGSRDAVLLVETDGTVEDKALQRTVRGHVFDVTGLTLHAVGLRPRGTLVKSTAGKISRHQNQALYERRHAAT